MSTPSKPSMAIRSSDLSCGKSGNVKSAQASFSAIEEPPKKRSTRVPLRGGQVAAVDHQRCSRHAGRVFTAQVEDRPGDVIGLSAPTASARGAAARPGSLPGPRSCSRCSRSIGVSVIPGQTQLQRTPERSIVKRDRTSQPEHGRFGSRVGRRRGLADEAADRPDIHDVASRVPPQILQAMFDREEDALEVDPHQPVPVGLVVFVQQLDVDQAGAVDDDVQAVESRDRLAPASRGPAPRSRRRPE